MGRKTLSDVAYERVVRSARSAGSATYAGEQRRKEGKGLHPLVDPKGYDVVRRSSSWLEPDGDHFVLLRGVAMLEETRLDTTGSMGKNVEIAMRVLPTTYNLLANIPNAVLGRYDTQMITSIFGDVSDDYVLCRSQAEMDERIAEQMTLMVPESDGGDFPEDPQYGLFGGAYLTNSIINKYGLKYYDFTVSDAPGRNQVDASTLVRVFGETVFDKVLENGYQIKKSDLPSTREVVQDLLKNAHAFFLQVGSDGTTGPFWERVFGKDRVVMIPKTEFLPQVKAAIIGLTEGTLDLQSLQEFLEGVEVDEGHGFTRQGSRLMKKSEAKAIVEAVSGIPIGAQASLPNFNKIPMRGEKFAKKGDLWPMTGSPSKGGKKTKVGSGKIWL